MDKKLRKAHVTALVLLKISRSGHRCDRLRARRPDPRAFMPDGKRYTVLGTDGFWP